MIDLRGLTAFEIIKDSHLYFKPLYNSQPEYYICHHHKCGRKFASEVIKAISLSDAWVDQIFLEWSAKGT